MIPANAILDADRRGLATQRIREKIERLIVGQDHVIDAIAGALDQWEAQFCDPTRPAASFLFLGPTGTGKTRIVEALADALLHNERAVVRIDCAEYQRDHEVTKLIGAPPGYLGHKETAPLLCQQALDRHQTESCKLSFVLFDEIEKASEGLWSLLLGVLDNATLTLGDNRKVDFSRAMIFMTSNLGASEMRTASEGSMGFSAHDAHRALSQEETARIGTQAAKRKFTPEFFNRLNHVVAFRTLSEEDLRHILAIELRKLQDRIYDRLAVRGFHFRVSEAASNAILRDGYDPRYGARHLKRAIDRLLTQPLARLVSSGQIEAGDMISVERDGERLTFRCEAKAVELAQARAA